MRFGFGYIGRMVIQIAAGILIAAFVIGMFIAGGRLTSSQDSNLRAWGYFLYAASIICAVIIALNATV